MCHTNFIRQFYSYWRISLLYLTSNAHLFYQGSHDPLTLVANNFFAFFLNSIGFFKDTTFFDDYAQNFFKNTIKVSAEFDCRSWQPAYLRALLFFDSAAVNFCITIFDIGDLSYGLVISTCFDFNAKTLDRFLMQLSDIRNSNRTATHACDSIRYVGLPNFSNDFIIEYTTALSTTNSLLPSKILHPYVRAVDADLSFFLFGRAFCVSKLHNFHIDTLADAWQTPLACFAVELALKKSNAFVGDLTLLADMLYLYNMREFSAVNGERARIRYMRRDRAFTTNLLRHFKSKDFVLTIQDLELLIYPRSELIALHDAVMQPQHPDMHIAIELLVIEKFVTACTRQESLLDTSALLSSKIFMYYGKLSTMLKMLH